MPPFSGTYGAAGSRRASRIPSTRASRRPDHQVYAQCTTKDSLIEGVVCAHTCTNRFMDNGRMRNCNHELFGADIMQGLENLKSKRNGFLKRSYRDRREVLYNSTRSRVGSNAGPHALVDYILQGHSGDIRLVCRPVVRAAYPCAERTLDRITKRRRVCVGPHAFTAGRTALDSEKRREAVGWWLAYADATAESLPDQPFLITPCRHKSEIYDEYVQDLTAAGKKHLIFHSTTFLRLYRNAPELDHVGISALKANFGRCSQCARLEEMIQRALKAHNSLDLANAKAERRAHLTSQRADRVEYWKRKADSRAGHRSSFIIDKMDSAKNQVPCWTNRWPKDAVKHAENILTLHICGIIFHGEPE